MQSENRQEKQRETLDKSFVSNALDDQKSPAIPDPWESIENMRSLSISPPATIISPSQDSPQVSNSLFQQLPQQSWINNSNHHYHPSAATDPSEMCPSPDPGPTSPSCISPVLICTESLDDDDDEDIGMICVVQQPPPSNQSGFISQPLSIGREVISTASNQSDPSTSSPASSSPSSSSIFGALVASGGLGALSSFSTQGSRPSAFVPFRSPTACKPSDTQIMSRFLRKILDATTTMQQITHLPSSSSLNTSDTDGQDNMTTTNAKWFHFVPRRKSPLAQTFTAKDIVGQTSVADSNLKLLYNSTVVSDKMDIDESNHSKRTEVNNTHFGGGLEQECLQRQLKYHETAAAFRKHCQQQQQQRQNKSESQTTMAADTENASSLTPTNTSIGELAGPKSVEAPLRTRLLLHLMYCKICRKMDQQFNFNNHNRQSAVEPVPPEVLSWWDGGGKFQPL